MGQTIFVQMELLFKHRSFMGQLTVQSVFKSNVSLLMNVRINAIKKDFVLARMYRYLFIDEVYMYSRLLWQRMSKSM